jgi:hypothetical protein
MKRPEILSATPSIVSDEIMIEDLENEINDLNVAHSSP